ncbi:MAG TPA: amino acid adenylation domain-containing protein, partial [Thermoanaerobaculia bacterium]
FFVNTLVLRTSLAGEPSFDVLLERAHETALDAFAHQELPFEKLVEVLQPERRLGETPLFSVLFALQNVPPPRLDAGGIAMRSLAVAPSATRFDWVLYARGDEAAVDLTLEYRSDVFHAATCERALGHLEALLAAALAAPERAAAELPMLGAAESHQLVVEAPAAPPHDPAPAVTALFEGWAARTPEAPAVVSDDRCWTYRELNARANRLARRLRAMGGGPEVPVVLYLPRSPGMVLGLLAVLKAGGAYLPIEPPLPPRRLEMLAAAVGARIAITTEALAGDLPTWVDRRLSITGDAVAEVPAGAGDDAAGNLGLAIPEQALAYVIHTSGSTGAPKAIGVERGHLAAYLRGALERLQPPSGASFALLSTFAADLGNTALFTALGTGGGLHVPAAEVAADAEAVADYGERHAIDCLKITPSHLRALLASTRPQSVLPRRLLVLGGEACDRELVRRVAELAPDCRVFNHYGPTETTVGIVCGRLDAAGGHGEPMPLGSPLPPVRCAVLDPCLRPLPWGIPGELHAGGSTVARGYLGRSDLTAERFLPDPDAGAAGGRRYRTGDRVRRRWDGQLEFLGRVDHQVKIRGFRVEPEGTEAVLRQHPQVAAAAVSVHGDGAAGGQRLVAYVVAANAAPTAQELRRFLALTLPEPMLPAAFVFLPALPLRPNGKLDRRALPPPHPGSGVTGRPPSTPLEEVVAAAWCEVLQREAVDVEADFFAAGGHSLLATQLASRLTRALGVPVPLRLLFEAATVARQAAELAALLAAGERPGKAAIARRNPARGGLPLSFAQERLWVLDRLAERRTAYLLHYFAEIHGPLVPPRLAAALTEVVRRHEVLRTRFPSREGRPVQTVLPPAAAAMPVVDLRRLEDSAAGAARSEALRLARAETRSTFDLAGEHPWRARLVRRGDAAWTLLLSLHHIASDAWSRGVLLRELSILYSALRRGERPRLPELPVQYADFALWQRDALRGDTLSALVAYWQGRLAGCPGSELPADRPRPITQSYRGGAVFFTLAAPRLAEIRALAHRRLATPFMVLLTALAALVDRYTGRGDVAIGSPVANRTRPEIEPLIGFFVNMLVLRLRIAAAASAGEALEEARQAALGAYAHQDLPFEKLLTELPPAREPGRQPLFQVVLAFQNVPSAGVDLGELTMRRFDVDLATSKFDLSFLAEESESGLAVAVEYSSDLFDRATVERLRHHWTNLLEGMSRRPEAALGDLPLLAPHEAHQLLREWNRRGPHLAGACAHQLFAAQGRRTPEAPALAWSAGEISYAELDRRARRLARRLRALGVGPEARVGLHLRRSPEMVISLLAVWQAGGAYVPLDPDDPLPRRLARCRHAGCAVVIGAAGPFLNTVREDGVAAVEWSGGDTAGAPPDGPPLPDETSPPDLATPLNLAYVLYTSGTTGAPKGVMVPHQALANYLAWSAGAYRAGEGGAPVHSSLGFDLTVTALLTPLVAGGTVVLLPDEHGIEALARGLQADRRFALIKLTPAHLELLSRQLPPGRAARAAGCLVIGGEALRAETLAWFREHAPDTRLINEYGPTETVVGCAAYEV